MERSRDSSGGAISGAAVKLTNQGTDVTKANQTNADGYFFFINVLPGWYVLTVEKQGFKTAQISISSTARELQFGASLFSKGNAGLTFLCRPSFRTRSTRRTSWRHLGA